MNDVVLSAVAKARALWACRDRGVTAVEYALMVAFIATVLIATVTVMGLRLSNTFVPVNNHLP